MVASSAPTEDSYAIYEISPSGLRREERILQQQPTAYTLQLVSVLKEEDIIIFYKTEQYRSRFSLY